MKKANTIDWKARAQQIEASMVAFSNAHAEAMKRMKEAQEQQEKAECKKFEVGKTYYTRSICDSNCIFAYKVVSRTASTITIIELDKTSAEPRKCRVSKGSSAIHGCEAIKPLGNYSMSPTLTANRYFA